MKALRIHSILRLAMATACLAMIAAVPAAASPITWTLQDVTFLDGYSATGQFTLNTSEPGSIAVTGVDIILLHNGTAFDTLTSGSYAASGFGSSNAVFLGDSSSTNFFTIEQNFQTNGPVPLNSSGTILDLDLGAEGYGVTGGELVSNAVPEPASLWLLCTGALGLLGLAWRRRGAAIQPS